MKGTRALHRLRAIFAILIAVSLTLAPATSAWAAAQMRTSMGVDAAVNASTDEAMSDCMKAMQAQAQAVDQNCPCCDTPSKAACPDMGACLAKCSFHIIAILASVAEDLVGVFEHDQPTNPHKPPDWALAPPAPPPRA